MPIIESLLDTDLYKLTMMQAVFHQCAGTMVEYEFKCRNKDIDLSSYAVAINNQLHDLCGLRFTEADLSYLSKLRFMKPDFIELLRMYKLDPRFVTVDVDPVVEGDAFLNSVVNDVTIKNQLRIKIAGPWLHTILFEVPLLAIVNEIYFRDKCPSGRQRAMALADGRERIKEKVELVRNYRMELEHLIEDSADDFCPFLVTDFGTRRRFAAEWHREVVKTYKNELQGNFVGTSNVMLAREFNLTPIGTMAHEWLQAPQGLDVALAKSQQYALQKWADEYRGDLGIALSDVVGFNAFLDDFDLYFAKLFDGCRHDSGDPAKWCERLIEHYIALGITPMTKRAVFSDGLTIPKAIELHKEFRDKIGMGFGIGTNLTNDVGFEPLQIVIKLTKVNGNPVAKVSDVKGKTMCKNEAFLAELIRVFKIKG